MLFCQIVTSGVSRLVRRADQAYCADGSWLLRSLKATETHTFYSAAGDRLTSFPIAPADCQQW